MGGKKSLWLCSFSFKHMENGKGKSLQITPTYLPTKHPPPRKTKIKKVRQLKSGIKVTYRAPHIFCFKFFTVSVTLTKWKMLITNFFNTIFEILFIIRWNLMLAPLIVSEPSFNGDNIRFWIVLRSKFLNCNLHPQNNCSCNIKVLV